MSQETLEKYERIEREINEFAEGNPKSFEILIADGIYFNFDCPYNEDLREPKITVAIGIMPDSPHNEGEPTRPVLNDYSKIADEIVGKLGDAFYNAGSRNEELVFEYSPESGHVEKGHYLFLGEIHNPRISIRPADGKVGVNEGYV
jgi:hypothetical protein